MLLEYKIQKDFKAKHEFAVKVLLDIAREECYELRKTITSLLSHQEGEKVLEEFSDVLSPELIHVINSDFTSQKNRTYKLLYTSERYEKENTLINVYGYPTFGDNAASMDKLEADMTKTVIVNEELRTEAFNVYDHIHVLIFGGKLIIDVSELLLRVISSVKFKESEELYRKAIKETIISKYVMFIINLSRFRYILSNEYDIKDVNIGYVKTDAIDNFGIRSIDFACLHMLFLQYVYNVSNGTSVLNHYDDLGHGEFLIHLQNLAKLMTSKMVRYEAVKDIYTLTIDRLTHKRDVMPRYIQMVMDEAEKDLSKLLVSVPVRASGRNLYRYGKSDLVDDFFKNHQDFTYKITDTMESFGFVDLEDVKAEGPASLTMFGTEAVDPSSKNYKEFRKTQRGKLLAKLSSKDRAKYIRIENDFIKLKADASNVYNRDGQKISVNALNKLGTIIQLEMDRSTDELFIELLSMLDSERFAIIDSISERDFFRERNNRLYGQVKTTNKWDY